MLINVSKGKFYRPNTVRVLQTTPLQTHVTSISQSPREQAIIPRLLYTNYPLVMRPHESLTSLMDEQWHLPKEYISPYHFLDLEKIHHFQIRRVSIVYLHWIQCRHPWH